MMPNNILKKRSPRVLEAKIKNIINKIKIDVLYIYITISIVLFFCTKFP